MLLVPITRVRPYSERWGFERGRPVDRFYVERFVTAHRADVQGRVLEIQSSSYADALGGPRITSLSILDLDPGNHKATLIGDLSAPETLAGLTFDCAIVTQTLQFVPDLQRALQNLWNALAPGGVLLLTVPAVSPMAPEFPDLWRFTPAGLERTLQAAMPEAAVEVAGAGNLSACVSFLLALSVDNVGLKHLRDDDAGFPLVCCGRVVRPA
jgi:SAM-dependent methyltransferase